MKIRPKKEIEVFMIPGLGFTHEIFLNIHLIGVKVHYINWLEPLKNETFEHYVERMSDQIRPEEKSRVVLLGHSFGGMVAQKMLNYVDAEALILISSIVSRKEHPIYFKMLKPLGLYLLITKQFILFTFPYWAKSHGYKQEEERKLFKRMVSDYSNYYFSWSLRQLSVWKPELENPLVNTIRIHGEKDKTFPILKTKSIDYRIKGGSHIALYQEGAIISRIIEDEIAGIRNFPSSK